MNYNYYRKTKKERGDWRWNKVLHQHNCIAQDVVQFIQFLEKLQNKRKNTVGFLFDAENYVYSEEQLKDLVSDMKAEGKY